MCPHCISPEQSLFFSLDVACLAEKQQIQSSVLGLTQPEPTIYRTWKEHAYNYTTDVVAHWTKYEWFCVRLGEKHRL